MISKTARTSNEIVTAPCRQTRFLAFMGRGEASTRFWSLYSSTSVLSVLLCCSGNRARSRTCFAAGYNTRAQLQFAPITLPSLPLSLSLSLVVDGPTPIAVAAAESAQLMSLELAIGSPALEILVVVVVSVKPLLVARRCTDAAPTPRGLVALLWKGSLPMLLLKQHSNFVDTRSCGQVDFCRWCLVFLWMSLAESARDHDRVEA